MLNLIRLLQTKLPDDCLVQFRIEESDGWKALNIKIKQREKHIEEILLFEQLEKNADLLFWTIETMLIKLQ